MEIQKSQKSFVQQDQLIKTISFEDFRQYIHNKNPSIMTKKYFTELDLISDYVRILCQFCLEILSYKRPFKFDVSKKQADQDCHTVHIKLSMRKFQFTWQILMIQMDQIIKLNIKYLDSESKKYQTLDSFWFAYQKYLNQKISNTYKIVSLKEFGDSDGTNKTQLNYLFVSRILSSLTARIPEIEIINSQDKLQSIKIITQFDGLRFFNRCKSPKLAQNFYQALGASQNFIRICSFLHIRSIVSLKLVSRFAKNYFFRNEKALFKQLYEYNYGKTGFEIDQMDWKKLLNKKRSEKNKQKKSNQQFLYQGIFRTH